MNKAEILEIIKSNILYYYTVALIFILLTVYSMHFGDSAVLLTFLLPIITVILGFFAGTTDSYAKWGFPIYIMLLNFCLSVIVFSFAYWSIIILGFVSSLIGVTIRHMLHTIRRRNKK